MEDGCLAAAAGKVVPQPSEQTRSVQALRSSLLLGSSSIDRSILMVAFIVNRTTHHGLCSYHSLSRYELPDAGHLFGPLAEYRIEVILAALILLVSLPKLPGALHLQGAAVSGPDWIGDCGHYCLCLSGCIGPAAR